LRAFQCVYARLREPISMVIDSQQSKVSVGGIITDTAAFEIAMVRRVVFHIRPGATRFIFHTMVVARAKRLEVAA
jgi:hypothetical protein